MKIAVIGAGVFGCVTALDLKEHISNDVTLFDLNDDILQGASKVNQYRLHRGYHYPRSVETALQSKQGFESFKHRFPECVTDYGIDHYYGLAKGSITATDYIKFLDEVGLSYSLRDVKDSIFNPNEVSAAFVVDEQSLDYNRFKQRLQNDLIETDVKVQLNTKFNPKQLNEFDLVINCTYSNINYLLPEEQRINYQFELVEKCKIDWLWGKMSGVVLDGDYVCIDPTGDGNEHQLGHVKHAIHQTHIGHFFHEITFDISGTRYWNIVSDLKKYFKIQHFSKLETQYIVRTVLPNREHDDARPSYITKHNDGLYSIFSGKIDTVVDISNELIKMLKQ